MMKKQSTTGVAYCTFVSKTSYSEYNQQGDDIKQKKPTLLAGGAGAVFAGAGSCAVAGST